MEINHLNISLKIPDVSLEEIALLKILLIFIKDIVASSIVEVRKSS